MEGKNGLEYEQNYDFIVKWMTEVLRGGTLDFMGLSMGMIADVFAFEPTDISVKAGRVDIIVRNEHGDLFHIEEQRNLGKSDMYRFAAYHFLGAKKWGDELRAPEKIKSPLLLVFWPVFRVAPKVTYNEYAPFGAP